MIQLDTIIVHPLLDVHIEELPSAICADTLLVCVCVCACCGSSRNLMFWLTFKRRLYCTLLQVDGGGKHLRGLTEGFNMQGKPFGPGERVDVHART